jgi:hypothetical protein
VPLKLVVAANGFERSYDITTDTNGDFSHSFEPLPGESGLYKVSAVHPDIVDRPEQGQFQISRVTVSPTKATLNVPRNLDQPGNFVVASGDGTTATNVRLEYLEADQPGGVFAQGLQITLPPGVDLAPNSSASLNVSTQGDDTAAETGSFVLTLKSDESGADALARVTVDYNFSVAEPVLGFSPNFVDTGMLHGDNITEIVTLENKGFAPFENVQLNLLTAGGSAAPAWVSLASPSSQNSIAVGESRPVQIVFAPDSGIAEGLHQFKLRVTSDNYATTDINLFATVTTSAIGSVLFRASDIYTLTLDEEGERILGLAGASFKLINEVTSEILPDQFTDNLGEVEFKDIPAGRYRFRASAANHEDKSGSIRVKPAVTVAEDVFLDYNLISVEWAVNEITIDDVYQITLRATFETNVPTAVVVAEPPSVELPDLQPGDVYFGEFTLTNYGLIRADNLVVNLPPDDQYFRYELMGGLPDTIDPNQRITVAYRAIMLQSLNPTGNGSGGACTNYVACGTCTSDSQCANGETAEGETGHCVTRSTSASCENPPGGIDATGGSGFIGQYPTGSGDFSSEISNDNIGISACRPTPDGGGPPPLGPDGPNCPPDGNGGGQ